MNCLRHGVPPGSKKNSGLLAHVDAQYESQRHHICRQSADTVAHKRQRDARNGHNTAGHADIDENFERPHGHNARHQEHTERISAFFSGQKSSVNENKIKEKNKETTQKTEFFPDNGKNEVRMVFR